MATLVRFFGTAFLINLPERVDRLRSAEKQLKRVNWHLGAEGVRLFPAKRFADAAGFPNAATRGCFHSHLECLRRAAAEKLSSVLILEDDIGLANSLPRLTSIIESKLFAEEWDFAYFGHYLTGSIPTANQKTTEGDVRFELWTEEIIGTHFYAVSGRILQKLIAHLDRIEDGPPGDSEAGPMSLDGAYNVFRRKNPEVRCLIVSPKLGWQMASRSDIAPHWLDTVPAFRGVLSVLRTLKQAAAQWRS